MDVEEFYERPAPEALIGNAVERLNNTNAKLLVVMKGCVEDPNNRTSRVFMEHSDRTEGAFSDAVNIAVKCDELSPRDRAGHIAAICLRAEDTRLGFLKEVSPEGEFQDGPNTHEDLRSMFEDLIESGLDEESIVEHAANIYTNSFNVDLRAFIEAAPLSRKARTRFLLKDLGSETIQLGKLALAVTAGSLLAHQIVKKAQRR